MTDEEILPRQLEILQHALGLDKYGKPPHGFMSPTRNYFAAGVEDEPYCRELVRLGLMIEHRVTETYPDYNVSVTNAGREYVRLHSEIQPRLTRGQQRYQRFLDADLGISFKEFLGLLREVER